MKRKIGWGLIGLSVLIFFSNIPILSLYAGMLNYLVMDPRYISGVVFWAGLLVLGIILVVKGRKVRVER